MHKAWKRHQDAVYWVDIKLAMKKRLKFYQTRSNAIILHETLPAYCIPKVVRMETGDVIFEKVYISPRPPPKISLKHDWKRELGSEHAQRPEGQVVQQSRSFQSNQPIPNRTGQPVVGADTRTVPDGCETRSCHESMRLNVEDETLGERSGQPVVNHDDSSHEQTMLNEVTWTSEFQGYTFCCEACTEHKSSRIDSEN